MTDLHRAFQGLAAAVEANPDDVETIRRALHVSRDEGGDLLAQVVRSARDPKLGSAVRNLKAQATAAAEGDDDDDDDDEIDWGEVVFIGIMILTL